MYIYLIKLKNMTTEDKIKQIETLLNEVKNELNKPKSPGNWYKTNMGHLIYFVTETSGYGFESDNKWNNLSEGHALNNGLFNWSPATDIEVEKALIREARERKFKPGIFINQDSFNHQDIMGINKINRRINNNKYFYNGESNSFSLNGRWIFKDGKWAEIVKDEYIKIGDYEVICTEDNGFKIGCKNICRTEIEYMKHFMINHKFKKVSFDGIEVDLETIEKILNM